MVYILGDSWSKRGGYFKQWRRKCTLKCWAKFYMSLICLFTFCSYQEGYMQASKKMENSVLRDFSRRDDDIHSCFKQKQDYSHVLFPGRKRYKLPLQRWEILFFKMLTFFILWHDSIVLFHILYSAFKGESIWKVSHSSSFNQLQIKGFSQKTHL